MRAMRWLGCVLALAIGGPGCTAITSGDFEAREEPLVCGNDLASSRVDMRLDLTDMNAHIDNLTVVDLVRISGVGPTRTRRSVARAVYEPLGEADLEIALPCTVLDGNHEVDLYADLNGNGVYDPCRDAPEGCVDHQWRLMLQADGTVSYQHDVDFVNIEDDAPLPRAVGSVRATFRNMGQRFGGRMLEMHVRRPIGETGEHETVLVYRLGRIPDSDEPFEREQPNLVELRERYEVAIWIDVNDDGVYDPPSELGIEGRDYATIISQVAEPGLRVNFDASGNNLPAAVDIRREP